MDKPYIALDNGMEHLREFFEGQGYTVYTRGQIEAWRYGGTTAITWTVDWRGEANE